MRKSAMALLAIALFPVCATWAQDPLPTHLDADAPAPMGTTAPARMADSGERMAPPVSWEQRIRAELDGFAVEADRAPFAAGISVWDLDADSLLWDYNSHKVMRPASTQKVLTAIAALRLLGADYEFKTVAYHTGEILPDSTLQGDIVVVGGFDPMYSIADLRDLARRIRHFGIRRIQGRIVGDDSMKNADLYGNGWCWDDVPSVNQPYLSPLMVERGRMYPDFKKYSTDPAFHPATHFAYALSRELAALGVTSNDSCPDGDNGGCVGPRMGSQTRTLGQVMQRMLKNSDNLHAEAVFFQLAHAAKGDDCTWKDGALQVEKVLRQAGVRVDTPSGQSMGSVKVADGSGVSLYNYLTADIQVAMLRLAWRDEAIRKHFLPALPVAGVDGTLDTRMTKGAAYRNVRAKTGTLEGVVTLCGYATASNGHTLAFSILVNGALQAKVARDFQDRICQTLTQ